MIRITHSREVGNMPSRRSSLTTPALILTEAETRHARLAIQGVMRAFGGARALARAVGVKPRALSKRSRPGPGLVIAVARIAGISLDAMLAGHLTGTGICIACGGKGAVR